MAWEAIAVEYTAPGHQGRGRELDGLAAGGTASTRRGRIKRAFDGVFRPGPDRRLFYGWRIVGAASLVQTLVAGLFLQSYGAYVVPVQTDLGWSRTMLSAGFAMARTESAVLGPAQGHLIDRFGPRTIMRIGVVMFGLGFVLLSLVQRPWQFFVAMVVLAIGASFAGFLSVTVVVVNWFRRRRATALGMASTGFAFGGLLVPAVATLIATFGWRAAAMASGLLMLVLGPLVVQGMRHRPADLGLHVDGVAPEGQLASQAGADTATPAAEARQHEGARSPSQPAPSYPADFTARQALRTAAFWQISAGHGLVVMLVAALMVHLIPHLTELGYSLRSAGLVVALVTSMQLVGMVFGGVFGDRLSKQAIVVTAMIMHGLAALILSVADTAPLVIMFAIFHGMAWGARGPLLGAWRADFFGSTSFGAIMGYSSIVVMVGAASGPLLAGVLYDRLGDYTITLQLLSGLAAIGAVLFFFVRKPDLPTDLEGA